MRIPLPKLKAILLYFEENTDARFLGKTKLMKLLYFLDFMHLKKHGMPITHDSYVHLEYGPIPSAIMNLVDTTIQDPDNSILGDTISFEKRDGSDMYKMISLRKFSEEDAKLFSKNEMEILRRVCLRFGDLNTRDIVDASHKEAPWKETKPLEFIPYSLAAKDPDCLVSEEDINLAISLLS
ncbi:MAG: hypothetical protein A3C11_02860 [Candidatus Sungbacteria bacterium RIFCSPHIGHO2_02_FULL_49_12]|uniref:Antitoxin SocA-like Panacea domain-containing protein n=1 Tax=Candidatus Sungbacteria bacterium RIFCSPHIGHO2_02_FULL_49_12 TaxID=1802271 RepID=A0A1G2KMS9_9BACT|nr:MAG: hypothetical protein A3C11_02860 [Candidatus Sungbacteria bacterium RIFCSPHIGHO2_02_FULL_49_12]